MDDVYKKFVIEKILEKSGIVIAPVHSAGIISFVEKRLKKFNLSIEQYCRRLDSDSVLLNDLINQATTNETYFFREEKQFDYLKDIIFPNFRNRKLVIWSAACSTGEEPLSLLSLALTFNIDVEIYASDIDDNVLDFFKKGCYSKYSFRNDGRKYHQYLKVLGNADKTKSHFILDPAVFNKIKIFKYNLTDFYNFPINKKFDIILMRNVFIYFDIETRKLITENVASKLNEGGHLFYSINEIGNINNKIVPPCLKKKNYQQIYFYVKETSKDSFFDSSDKNIKRKDCNINYIKSKDFQKTECVLSKPCDVFYDINSALVKKDFQGALDIVNNYKPAFPDSYYSSFFKGYIFMKKEDYSNAERYFITSEFLKSSFWPVYFFHGIVLEKSLLKKKSLYFFQKCLEQMESYMEHPSSEYNFLLKEVSPAFIYSYCSRSVREM